MTVCIAARCEGGKAIVVASDRMLSAPFLSVEFDHQDAKIDQIGQNCVALSSGDALCVQDVLASSIGAANQLQNPSISMLAEQVKDQYREIRTQRINDFVLGTRGIDFDSFYQGGMIARFPQDLAMLIDRDVQTHDLGITILVSGVDESGAHIYSIENPGSIQCFDRLGYHAIGIGHRHATLHLVSLGQHQSASINETIVNVFCAKKAAELAPGVGQATTMKVVSFNETKSIRHEALKKFESHWEHQRNPVVQELNDTVAKISNLYENDELDESAEQ